MKFSDAIDEYMRDMRSQGRIRSPRSEKSYRQTLYAHLDDIGNRDPRTVGRDDIKRTLRRWANPNTQSQRRSVLVSFFDWTMEEGIRKDNPARQTRRPRRVKPAVYRLTIPEVRNFLNATTDYRERAITRLGVCAGMRSQELRLMRGRHLARAGWVWISADIAKGSRERWVPVLPDLEPVIAEIRERVGDEDHVLAGSYFLDPPFNKRKVYMPGKPMSPSGLWRIVRRVAERAGIRATVGPHTMRHAFADHIARYAGVRNAQYMLGHADLGTTEAYLGAPTLDELAASVQGMRFDLDMALPTPSEPTHMAGGGPV